MLKFFMLKDNRSFLLILLAIDFDHIIGTVLLKSQENKTRRPPIYITTNTLHS